jgi:hypothetical protein
MKEVKHRAQKDRNRMGKEEKERTNKRKKKGEGGRMDGKKLMEYINT